ncbi:MAG: hypothetical protein R3B57_03465 [Phycisphaerales bacterium]
MLERIADTFVAGVELLEAEGRVVRDRAAAMIGGAALAFALGVIGVLGALALATGLTWLLAREIGAPEAICVVGALLAFGAGWGAYETIRRLKT